MFRIGILINNAIQYQKVVLLTNSLMLMKLSNTPSTNIEAVLNCMQSVEAIKYDSCHANTMLKWRYSWSV